MPIKAVLFDLFETLITEFDHSTRISKRDYNYQTLLGLSNDEFKLEWRHRSSDRMNGTFADYSAVLEDILNKRQLKVNSSSIEALFEMRVEEKRIPFRKIRPDMLEMLAALKSSGVKLALVSNCTEEEIREWRHCELAPYFDEAIFSYEVRLAKPEKRIYELACSRLGVAPSEAIFIGDGGSKELEGASDAGLKPYRAVWFNSHIDSKFERVTCPADVLQLCQLAL